MSAVQKIARAVRLPAGTRVYRGLGGAVRLPPHFYKSDAKGRKGVAEWGFMSTTFDKRVALAYSGIKACTTAAPAACGAATRAHPHPARPAAGRRSAAPQVLPASARCLWRSRKL